MYGIGAATGFYFGKPVQELTAAESALLAGKTGSTNGSKAAWFAGFVPQLASSVWVGKPDPVELRDVTIGGRFFPQVCGGRLPAPIWGTAMSAREDDPSGEGSWSV